MGEHDPMKSIQLICCTDKSWYHKTCLKELAFLMKEEFACPKCNNKDEFRYNMLANGVFIPDNNYLPQPSTEIEDVPQAKRRRIHKNYILDRKFESKADAAAFIESENCWSYHYKNESTFGVRINYRCNLMKFRGTQCASGLYLLFDSTNSSVHLFRADAIHTHDDESNKENAVIKISGELEAEIRSQFESNQKPKSIFYNLVRKGFTPPPKGQLNNFFSKIEKRKIWFSSIEFWHIRTMVEGEFGRTDR